jgi:hypothetical protein
MSCEMLHFMYWKVSKTIVVEQCPLKLKRLLSLILTISTNLQNKTNNESIFVIMTTYRLDMREKPSSKLSFVYDIVHAAYDFQNNTCFIGLHFLSLMFVLHGTSVLMSLVLLKSSTNTSTYASEE